MITNDRSTERDIRFWASRDENRGHSSCSIRRSVRTYRSRSEIRCRACALPNPPKRTDNAAISLIGRVAASRH